jgi:hypothetical protein
MRGDLERRLRAVEVAGSGGIEIWTDQGDGTVRGMGDEQMTFENTEALGRFAGKFAIVIREVDARL